MAASPLREDNMDIEIISVTANWDEDVEVWVAESADVPGLVAEASSLDRMVVELRELIPELVELNNIRVKLENSDLPFSLTANLEMKIPYRGEIDVRKLVATLDQEAAVWIAESKDVPGLVAEKPTIRELAETLSTLIPELLELNGISPAPGLEHVPVSVSSKSRYHAKVA